MTEAIEHFQRAVRQDPANADARFNLARALETQGRWEEAIKEYGELLGINPDDEEAQKALAAALGRAASSQKSP
jgi:tetratricopeptide (TPR) repeat protein